MYDDPDRLNVTSFECGIHIANDILATFDVFLFLSLFSEWYRFLLLYSVINNQLIDQQTQSENFIELKRVMFQGKPNKCQV